VQLNPLDNALDRAEAEAPAQFLTSVAAEIVPDPGFAAKLERRLEQAVASKPALARGWLGPTLLAGSAGMAVAGSAWLLAPVPNPTSGGSSPRLVQLAARFMPAQRLLLSFAERLAAGELSRAELHRVDQHSVEIGEPGGATVTLIITPETKISQAGLPADLDDLRSGDTVIVRGGQDAAGRLVAVAIEVSTPGR
jgi:hypothetical protein